MFGWLMLTGKKILAALLLAALIYLAAPSFGFSPSASIVIIYALFAGMIFPDIDVVTGSIKKALHSIAVFILLFAIIVIALYPASINISGSLCTESLTYSLTGIFGLSPYCNAGTALILLIICYLIVRTVLGWFPEKNMLHSYLMAILIVACATIFSKFYFPDQLFIPVVLSFAIAYFAHLAIDGNSRSRK
ncbi:MAG: hypothetical protein V1822_04310 [Candidatus Micrarchaeota archaeon]